MAWAAVVVLVVGFLVAGAPEYYDQLRSLSDPGVGNPDAVRANLAEAGISVGFYAAYLLALDVVFAPVGLVVAALIFWRKSAEPVALLVALMLVSGGVDTPSVEALAANHAVVEWLEKCLSFLVVVCVLLFLYVFPDGRFVPRWMRWLMVLGVGSAAAQWLFPASSFDPDLAVFGLLISGVLAQIYRYRRVSGPVERRQTKWVVFGVTVAISGFLTTIMLPSLLFDSYPATGTLGDLLGSTVLTLLVNLIPLSIGVAVLRSGLFDIDIIINRALVYSALTATLALIYVSCVVGLQAGFRWLTGGGSDLAVVASTLAIASLFVSFKRRIQNVIDRRFYRRKYNAQKTLADFSAKLWNETDLDALGDDLVAVARQTMQPEHVSLWLRSPGGEPPRTAGKT